MTLAAICRSHVRRLGNNRGLTLIELLAVMAVIGVLAAIAVLIYANFDNQARIARACADIAILSSEISTFETLNERLPNNLAEINRATFLDPWGRPYEYLNLALGPGLARKDLALHPINSDFDLYSKGKDGVSQPPLTATQSRDDIVRANDGQFIGLASTY
jgi:general secretion pathway protein G